MDTPSRLCFLATFDPLPLRTALAAWRVAYPQMGVCAFLPEAQKERLGVLQALCTELQIPLVGGIFPALLQDGHFDTDGLWLLRLDVMPPYLLLADLPQDSTVVEPLMQGVARTFAAHLQGPAEATLFMLFDAMVPHIGSLLDQLYLQLANRVHYAGANAGSESFTPMPCLFDGQRLVGNGVLLLLLPGHKGAILEHGYQAPTDTVYATSTQGNCIAQIDWRPAFEVYQELVRTHYGVQITADNFYQHAVHFPFGIVRANHHVVVRIPVRLEDDGSLFCVGEVPANAVLTLLQSPTVNSTETLQVLCSGLQALNGVSGVSGVDHDADLLLFYCAGRRMHLGPDAASTELQALGARLPGSRIAGALSLGEIGGSTVHGYPLFHNATLVAAHW